MTRSPVVLVCFNRPDLTRRTLDAIRLAAPRELFVVADGPRSGHPDDADRTAAVRRELDRVDWPCALRTRLSPGNLGCEANVELGLDWVFSQVERAIVLEDDCIPDPTFFEFADALLDRYRDDQRVWQVAGNSHGVPTALFHGDSYAFSTWASVWGWATWQDRWQRHRAEFPRHHSGARGAHAPVRTRPARPADGTLVTRAGRRHFAEAAASDDVVTHGWDKHWWLTVMSHGGLSVTPAVNLVSNAGFGADATHSNAPGREDEPAQAMTFPLRHPAEVALDVEVERELELLLNRVGGPAARVARRVIKSPRLRSVARAVVNSEPAVRTTRLISRLSQRRVS